MNPLEIVLLILGTIIIVVSCILVDRSQSEKGQSHRRPLAQEISYSEDEIRQSKEKLNEILSKVSEETEVRTDDYLSKLSNEKIMAVSDFADQVMEKIKSNHDEVVFLYNMLNDKEKELKAAVKEIDTSKKKVQEITDSKKAENEQPAKTAPVHKPAQNSKPVQNLKPVRPDNPADQKGKATDSSAIDYSGANNNTQILSLYSKGKSVMEISKLLGLGQGEVKLVIELFQKRNISSNDK